MGYSVFRRNMGDEPFFDQDIALLKTKGRYHYYQVKEEIEPFVKEQQQLVLEATQSDKNGEVKRMANEHRSRLESEELTEAQLDLAVVGAVWDDTRNGRPGTRPVRNWYVTTATKGSFRIVRPEGPIWPPLDSFVAYCTVAQTSAILSWR